MNNNIKRAPCELGGAQLGKQVTVWWDNGHTRGSITGKLSEVTHTTTTMFQDWHGNRLLPRTRTLVSLEGSGLDDPTEIDGWALVGESFGGGEVR